MFLFLCIVGYIEFMHASNILYNSINTAQLVLSAAGLTTQSMRNLCEALIACRSLSVLCVAGNRLTSCTYFKCDFTITPFSRSMSYLVIRLYLQMV